MEDVKEVASLHTPMAELVQYATTLHQKVHMLSTAESGKEDDYHGPSRNEGVDSSSIPDCVGKGSKLDTSQPCVNQQ
jgi:hypothetical protein